MTDRFLVVNADDFGLSPGVNAGVARAHERGIVTSASLMVRRPAAAEAGAYARATPALSVGLHFDLGEWVRRDGEWVLIGAVVAVDDRDAVAGEVAAQLAAFERLVGRPPTHLDSHQHVHRSEPVRSVLVDSARRLGVPLRDFSMVRYRGDFYGQGDGGHANAGGITVRALAELIAALAPGWAEIACHPGLGVDHDSAYAVERVREVDVLCDPQIAHAIESAGAALRTFRDAPR